MVGTQKIHTSHISIQHITTYLLQLFHHMTCVGKAQQCIRYIHMYMPYAYIPLTQYILLYNIHLLNSSESETYKFAKFELYHTFFWVGF